MRILVLGAGVIGSVYAGKLLQAGHDVVMVARGSRLSDLQSLGLILEDRENGRRSTIEVRAVPEPPVGGRYDLVLVPVRAEQLVSTLPTLAGIKDGSDVLVFGNTRGSHSDVMKALGGRALFGFPAAGGSREGPVISYVLISQQKTMLGEPSGAMTTRLRQLQTVLGSAGFSTKVSANIDGWLLGHSAFIVPIAFALYRSGGDAAKLASDRATMRLMVVATRQAFRALSAAGEAEIPTNLRALYLRLPTAFAVAYWRRVMAGGRGELWFGAHVRSAPEEMRSLAGELQASLSRIGRPTPAFERLLAGPAQ
jgi:2-dehydropantoate 2-reductase